MKNMENMENTDKNTIRPIGGSWAEFTVTKNIVDTELSRTVVNISSITDIEDDGNYRIDGKGRYCIITLNNGKKLHVLGSYDTIVGELAKMSTIDVVEVKEEKDGPNVENDHNRKEDYSRVPLISLSDCSAYLKTQLDSDHGGSDYTIVVGRVENGKVQFYDKIAIVPFWNDSECGVELDVDSKWGLRLGPSAFTKILDLQIELLAWHERHNGIIRGAKEYNNKHLFAIDLKGDQIRLILQR